LKSNYNYIKYGLFAISIPILVYFLFASTSNSNQLPNTLGQTAAPATTSIPQLINNGNTLAAQGNYNGAISFYDKVLSLDPNNIKALYNKGKALSQLGNFVKSLNNAAISYYDKVLSLDPNNIGALYNKGNALVKLGNLNGAISSYDKVLSLDPNNIGALYSKGNALVKLGNLNGAISSFDKVLSLNSTNAKALKGKSDVQAKLDKQKGTKISPNIASTTPTTLTK